MSESHPKITVYFARLEETSEFQSPKPRPGSALSAEEVARAEDIRVPRARAAYLASRALLRAALAGHSGVPAAAIEIRLSPEGKPFATNAGGLTFSLAHSSKYWVCALTREREVGIDLEEIDRSVEMRSVARRLFARTEQDVLDRAAGEEQRRAFFRVWTQREAVVKCLGTGMLQSGREFEVEADLRLPVGVRGLAVHLAEVDVAERAVCVVAAAGTASPGSITFVREFPFTSAPQA